MDLSYGVLGIKLHGIEQEIHTITPTTSQAPVSILNGALVFNYKTKKEVLTLTGVPRVPRGTVTRKSLGAIGCAGTSIQTRPG